MTSFRKNLAYPIPFYSNSARYPISNSDRPVCLSTACFIDRPAPVYVLLTILIWALCVLFLGSQCRHTDTLMDAFSPRTLWDEYGIGADIITGRDSAYSIPDMLDKGEHLLFNIAGKAEVVDDDGVDQLIEEDDLAVEYS
ncbi:hypothetical protein B0H14DRAFT_3859032 [Mycena olivaceomarginata]|nr:hypothetical protein B0H14DRAFT_3859032 [Mycena olivaceomarginata]